MQNQNMGDSVSEDNWNMGAGSLEKRRGMEGPAKIEIWGHDGIRNFSPTPDTFN